MVILSSFTKTEIKKKKSTIPVSKFLNCWKRSETTSPHPYRKRETKQTKQLQRNPVIINVTLSRKIQNASQSLYQLKNTRRYEKNSKKIGALGEDFVIYTLRSENKEVEVYERVVEHTSKDDVGAGYDILLIEGEKKTYIEVKSTSQGENAPFFISQNEVDKAKEYKANNEDYVIYRVFVDYKGYYKNIDSENESDKYEGFRFDEIRVEFENDSPKFVSYGNNENIIYKAEPITSYKVTKNKPIITSPASL